MAQTPDERLAQIEELAAAPKRTRTDEGYVEERSVEDLIKAANHVATANALQLPHRGMYISRTRPPGTA